MKLRPGDDLRRSALPYPMEVGAPKFDLVPIEKEKDQFKNLARTAANEELSRLQEHWDLLVKQADLIKDRIRELTDRIELSDIIYSNQCEINFMPKCNIVYFLYEKSYNSFDSRYKWAVNLIGPSDWSSGMPHKAYLGSIKMRADNTWEFIERNLDVNR